MRTLVACCACISLVYFDVNENRCHDPNLNFTLRLPGRNLLLACTDPKPDPCGTGIYAKCVNFRNDPANCGGCGVKCPAGADCVAPSMGGGTGECKCWDESCNGTRE